MRARDVMSRPVAIVGTLATIREATALLAEKGFAALPVVDGSGQVVGMFSESDALRAAPLDRAALVTTAMTTPVEVVSPATDLAIVAERMLAGRLRCLPVVEEGLLLGVVARRDLLRALVRDDDLIESGLRRLLDDYAGSRRHGTVEVRDGEVRVSGDFADNAERDLVAALARTVSVCGPSSSPLPLRCRSPGTTSPLTRGIDAGGRNGGGRRVARVGHHGDRDVVRPTIGHRSIHSGLADELPAQFRASDAHIGTDLTQGVGARAAVGSLVPWVEAQLLWACSPEAGWLMTYR